MVEAARRTGRIRNAMTVYMSTAGNTCSLQHGRSKSRLGTIAFQRDKRQKV